MKIKKLLKNKICLAIQARYSSERLPGKVLKEVAGTPILEHTIKRLQKTKLFHSIYVLTSNNSEDLRIINFCESKSYKSFSCSLENVFKRFKSFLKFNSYDAFVRISGDSPLIDPFLIDKMVNKFRKNDYDILTNVFPRTFPSGQSVEIIKSKTFLKVDESLLSKEDKEHVTSFFYKNNKRFNIENFECKYSHKNLKLSIDTHADFDRFVNFLKKNNKSLPEDIKINDIVENW